GTVQVDRPAAGQWNLSASAPGNAGYLMVAALDSDLQATLSFAADVVEPGSSQDMTVAFAPGRAVAASRAQADVARSRELAHSRPAFAAAGNGGHKGSVAVPQGNAIHNVTATVTGTLDDGSAFERTLVSSFAAVAAAERGHWTGR
ncbi:MAG TPA: hypothetical protein VNT75_03050, partial [Symbiobacteriaceae bacterium]|nr:hypothetical protein [Symbiobacteriaceae bacterium]